MLTYTDIKYLQKIYNNENFDINYFLNELKENNLIKIANKKDIKKIYKDFIAFEKSFPIGCRNLMTFRKFKKELNKGYGNSNYIQIARIMKLSNGYYYDNNYAQ